jgi:tRNA (guanine37-N1)-methyltransferase
LRCVFQAIPNFLHSFEVLTFHVITLFPDLLSTYTAVSVIGRGIKAERLAVKTYNPRDFCADKYKKVDDTPYGGGAGMVLKPEPFFAAYDSICESIADDAKRQSMPVLLMSPQGQPFSQTTAQSLSTESDIAIICGHYEGFDERIRTLSTHEVCIGDYILTGGELASLVVIDAVGRLVPGVLGKIASVHEESFSDGILEAPQYTKPPEFRGMAVPEILRGGDHKAITSWRRRQALTRTFKRRPDLLQKADLSPADRKLLDEIESELNG